MKVKNRQFHMFLCPFFYRTIFTNEPELGIVLCSENNSLFGHLYSVRTPVIVHWLSPHPGGRSTISGLLDLLQIPKIPVMKSCAL